MLFEQLDELGFLAVAYDQVGTSLGEICRPPLGIAASGDDLCAWIASPGAAHGLARVRIARAGDRAGIDHVHIGLRAEGHD